MPKPDLKEPFASLESELIEVLSAGHKQWRPDLDYPQSYSDMQGAVRAVIKAYDVKRRAISLESKDILAPPDACIVCKKSIDFGTVTDLGKINGKSPTYAHVTCVNRKMEK